MPEETRVFECSNGLDYEFPKNHCAFCIHCTDVFYDYSSGPYLFVCTLGHRFTGECNDFEDEDECDEEG